MKTLLTTFSKNQPQKLTEQSAPWRTPLHSRFDARTTLFGLHKNMVKSNDDLIAPVDTQWDIDNESV